MEFKAAKQASTPMPHSLLLLLCCCAVAVLLYVSGEDSY